MKQLFLFFLILVTCSCQQPEKPKMLSQYPSPMVEYTRPHHRIPLDSVPDTGIEVALSEGVQGKLYTPAKWKNEQQRPLLIHFHGDYRVARHAIDQQAKPWILFHGHWGGGSSTYSRPMEEMGANVFLDSVLLAVRKTFPEVQLSGVYLSAWSAGYGAIRSLIGNEKAASRIDGILLLDGLHCSYMPERKVLAEGGVLDSTQMQPFLDWARLAANDKKSFLYTHSAVFPGTYASTTETAEYLLQKLNIHRQSLLAEGPMGMQQTSMAKRGKLQIFSFAGNSAPDHVDHYHGMGAFLRLILGKIE